MSLESKVGELSDYSESVQEVLSRPPHSLLTSGILVIVGIFLALSLTTYLLKYPDIITGPVVITTQEAPVKVYSQATGRLVKLFKQDAALISINTPIAEIENATRTENINVLMKVTKDIEHFLATPLYSVRFPSDTLTFGPLQTEYNTLQINYQAYFRLVHDSYVSDQIELLQHQITDYTDLLQVIKHQSKLTSKVLTNEAFRLSTNQRLYTDKVISKLDLLQTENGYLQTEKEQNGYEKTYIETKLILSDKKKQLLDILYQKKQQSRQFHDTIKNSLQAIRNQLTTWRLSYLITAPITGKLRYLKRLAENQTVYTSDTLFSIIPIQESLLAIAQVPVQNMGKLRKGQRVILKLDNFPFQEFGVVAGQVVAIAPTPNLAIYRVSVRLPDGLMSSFHKRFPFRPEMTGTAEIVTEDLRLVDRLFYELRKSLLNR